MRESILLPKFLTKELASFAVSSVINGIFEAEPRYRMPLKRRMCHIVVLVPSRCMDDDTSYPNYTVRPHVLYQHSLGQKSEWPHRFDKIAKSKALELWQDRNDDRTDIMPHLLFTGETPYWGGVKRRGIVVTCSGVQPWFDKMVSGMIADAMVALAYDAWMNSQIINGQVDFLT